MSFFGTVKINTNNPAGDSFGRLRTSSPSSLFDAQLSYDLQPLLFEQKTNASGATITHDATNRTALMTFANTPNGGSVYMQTYEHFRYRAGHSQLIFVTFNMGEAVTDVIKFAGYSDGTEGIELQRSGSTVQLVLYSTTSNGNQTVAQASWNIDTMLGTGISGKTLDLTKIQILAIDFQALYAGRVRVGFDINGVLYWVHEFNHANLITTPYIKTANLPIRCGMTCTNTVSTTMNFICSTVQTENGYATAEGFHFSQDASATAANGVKTHLISLQPKTTFNSITNRSKIIIDSVDLVVTGARPIHYDICIGDTLTGSNSFSDVNTTYSAAQYNTNATTSGTPSIIIQSGHVAASATSKGSVRQDVALKYPITLNQAGDTRSLGTVTVLVTGLGAASDVEGTINWVEIR
jgi:hypothetical protein